MHVFRKFCLWATLVVPVAGTCWAQSNQAPQAQPSQAQPVDQTQPQANPAPSSAMTVSQAIDRITAREHDQDAIIRRYSPIIETYVQDMKPDKEMGSVPERDHYFLGQADLSKAVIDNSMLVKRSRKLDEFNPLSHLAGMFTSSYIPAGFLQMVYIDTSGFDRQHYQFDYIGRQFLGDVRCLVFDVTPLPKSGKGRFKGRIWAEDQNFTIVRFNGIYTPIGGVNGFNLHFDSWRLNMQSGLWLPAFIYSQESDLKDFFGNTVQFKAQTRLWGYNLKNASHEETLSEMTIESPNAIQDQAPADQDRSPVEAEREWQHQAEVNVLDRMQRDGLLSPPSDVDKVLETVVNNLEVTNNLDIEPDVHCRVLLTGTLESFSIGHTIVLSRGLIDVLPDEASLATVIAQELADLMVMKPSTDEWGFNDMTDVSTVDAVARFSFRDTPDQLQAASQKAVELLKNSPYKDKLATAGLFLKQLDATRQQLPALISPHVGNRVLLYTQLMSTAPALQPDKLDQIAALPIGARLKLDPWTDRVELLKAKPIPLLSAREKKPFEITPFMPYLTRYEKPAAPGDPSKSDLAKQQQPQPPQQQ
jgi:hypothetical protein